MPDPIGNLIVGLTVLYFGARFAWAVRDERNRWENSTARCYREMGDTSVRRRH